MSSSSEQEAAKLVSTLESQSVSNEENALEEHNLRVFGIYIYSLYFGYHICIL